jgi:hypothetical protein
MTSQELEVTHLPYQQLPQQLVNVSLAIEAGLASSG